MRNIKKREEGQIKRLFRNIFTGKLSFASFLPTNVGRVRNGRAWKSSSHKSEGISDAKNSLSAHFFPFFIRLSLLFYRQSFNLTAPRSLVQCFGVVYQCCVLDGGRDTIVISVKLRIQLPRKFIYLFLQHRVSFRNIHSIACVSLTLLCSQSTALQTFTIHALSSSRGRNSIRCDRTTIERLIAVRRRRKFSYHAKRIHSLEEIYDAWFRKWAEKGGRNKRKRRRKLKVIFSRVS